ncbi:MAG: hypothetical protein IJJ33_12315 [Victivallales bacterium]|nr:hypothetical protein [Victivallales bacterium]
MRLAILGFFFLASLLFSMDAPIWDFGIPQPDWGKPFGMSIQREAGALRLDISESDSRLINRNVRLDTSICRFLHLTYRAEGFADGHTTGELFYGLDTAPGISAKRYIALPSLKCDGKRHELYVSLSWAVQGVVNLLRLDLVNQAPGVIHLEKLEFLERAPAGKWNLNLPPDWPSKVANELPPRLPPSRNVTPEHYFQGKMTFYPNRGELAENAFLRHEFTLDFSPGTAWLQVMADDRVEAVYVNGAPLHGVLADSWREVNVLQVANLRIGKNLLAIKYVNEGGQGGVLYELAVLGQAKEHLRVNSGEGAWMSVSPAKDWFRPDADLSFGNWQPASVTVPPPAPPWGKTLSYIDYIPDDARGTVDCLDLKASWNGERLALTAICRPCPPFAEKDEAEIRIHNAGGRLVSRQRLPIAQLHPKKAGENLHLTLESCDVTRYGGAMAGTVKLQFPGRGMKRTDGAEFALPSRPLPGAETPLRAERQQVIGGPILLMDGKPVFPIFLSASETVEQPNQKVETGLEGADSPVVIREFAVGPPNAEWWTGDHLYDFEVIDRRIHSVMQDFPQAKIGIWLKCQPGPWYARAYPERLARNSKGGVFDYYAAAVTFSGHEYQEDAGQAIRALVEHCEKHYGNKIAVYNLCGGVSLEWQAWGCHWLHKQKTMFDYSDIAARDFRAFALEHCGIPLAIPSYDERLGKAGVLFRSPAAELPSILFDEYYSASVADCILACAHAVRQGLAGRRKLVSAYYGYVFEYGQYAWALNAAGHNATRQLLEGDSLDYLLSPNSYYNRGIGETNGDMKAFGSLRAHGKFSILEDDTRTHLAGWAADNGQLCKTLNETHTTALLRRNWGMSLARRMPINLLPLEERRDLNSPQIRADLETTRQIGQALFEHPRESGVQVAFVLDETSLKYLTPQSRRIIEPGTARYLYDNPSGALHRYGRQAQLLTGSLITEQRDRLAQTGTGFDQILLSDVPKLAKQYKFWILTCAFAESTLLRTALEALRRENVTVVIPYGAAFVSKTQAVDAMSMSTHLGVEFAVIPPGTTEIQRCHDGGVFGLDSSIPTRFAVNDATVKPLGHYLDGGAVALAEYAFGKATIIFCGSPMIPAELMAEWMRQAGVHCYTAPGDTFFAGYGIVTIHSRSSGRKTIRFPHKVDVWDVYEKKLAAIQTEELSFTMNALETRVFLERSGYD